MNNTQESTESFQQLFENVKKYIVLQGEFVKIDIVEKMTVLMSTIFIIVFTIILALTALFYVFFAVAYALEPYVGSLSLSFGFIAFFYVVLILLFILFRKRLVVNPLVKLLYKLFMTKNQ